MRQPISSGNRLAFPKDLKIREDDWTLTPPPSDAKNRNVEIIVPVNFNVKVRKGMKVRGCKTIIGNFSNDI